MGVSNETSWGVMEFVYAAKQFNLPKIVSIQNSYSLLTRTAFESTCLPLHLHLATRASLRLYALRVANSLPVHFAKGR